MHLTKPEKNFKENVTKIIKNNQNDIKKAIKIISELNFNGKKVGTKKAREICNFFIEESVEFVGKSHNFDYVRELNENLRKINN